MADLRWRKASFSDPNGSCVSFAETHAGTIALRNSNHPDAGTLTFARSDLAAWIDGCKTGEFDDLSA